ncbi:E3 ubiquitin-protein ligase MBR2-like [Carya illinoinensis]|uniref:RING-type E3 ubiquitin transferase n=1 Tax=Carya illinoinensis TaxID=32201 RepID=A0A8T1RGT9_CARIL|nr:E3 ubiquitin-protein ligase MBR2-like [Carya illinoinensis]XP_042973876.1 E3 ubiquitin-protein ligase MBR2-like [Carya illinoinensis]XP_042973885.1 E3 ubiquitin-protein ligase MBR2-like [Carya illinoinensis]XP_042973894.1 E3 ubiquitin-protein ligase MBR2-like [Carya illinoinensis]XP_042973902.1 E3 ubiquitin-protein ligase MBR2-like [Carya illinoinensis]XP_042973911.1 E3 ubiquitin-protein ligase MBR2-like [Carya illinoinensis]XP_042973918.1 E3 ubiquitin-protein ligase MBR2-like [Carya illin
MNGQGSSSNSFPETFHVDHGPNVNNPGFLQNNGVPTNSAVDFGPTVISWMGQSSSCVNPHNQVNPEELLGGHGWLSSIGAPDGTGQTFEVSHSKPNIAPFQQNANVIPIDVQVTNGTSILHGSSSGVHNIDFNALHEIGNSDANQDMGAGLSLRLFNSDGLEAKQNPPASNSSIPVMISSGISGYELEENNGREGLSSDGRRISCKRRPPEDAPGLLYLGESSSTGQESANSEWQAVLAQEKVKSNLNTSTLSIPPSVSHPDQLGDRIGAGMMGAVSRMHQTSSGAGEVECSQRNIRPRRAANPQDVIQLSMLPSGATRNSYLQSPIQTTMFSPFAQFPNSSLAETLPVNGTAPVQAFSQVRDDLQNLQPSPWYDLTWPRAGGSSLPHDSTPDHAVNGGSTLQQEQNSRNTLLVPETDRENVALYPITFNFVNGNSNSPGNISSSSQDGTLSCGHFISAPTRVSEPSMTELYGQRFSDFINRSMTAFSRFECRGWGTYCPLHARTSAAAREMDLSVRGGIVRPFQVYQTSGWMISPERQDGSHPENPFALESIVATQLTNRLISEVRDAVALVRRGGTLQIEDVLVMDPSVLYEISEDDEVEVPDDMYFDVDSMSYEQLLALGEHVGDVCIGLSEEAIVANLRQQKYKPGSPVKDESCCICLEEYIDGDDLGKLDCGHNFHFTCIKQWLVQKNCCPICKMKALTDRERGT